MPGSGKPVTLASRMAAAVVGGGGGATAPAPAPSQPRRRVGCRIAPIADTASQPRLCSPKYDMARATASAPGRSANADCTATSTATSPLGEAVSAVMSAIARHVVVGRQQHRLPFLLAGQHRQRIAVGAAHLVEAAQQLPLAAQ